MKLLILDGNSVINRAYFGVKPLTTREGLYTHAIYGFLNILERMEKEEQPDAVAVAFERVVLSDSLYKDKVIRDAIAYAYDEARRVLGN